MGQPATLSNLPVHVDVGNGKLAGAVVVTLLSVVVLGAAVVVVLAVVLGGDAVVVLGVVWVVAG